MFAKLSAALVFLAFALPAHAAQSVYTDLDLKSASCKQIGGQPTQEDIDLGVVAMKCAGYKKVPVFYNEGDERTSVYFGDLDKVKGERGWESFEGFNHVGDKVEWRIDDKGAPYAAILRYHVLILPSDPDKGTKDVYGQVLVVYKVSQLNEKSGCAIGLVDALANKDANDQARKLADDLSGKFECRKDSAVYHGAKGDKAGEFYAYWGE